MKIIIFKLIKSILAYLRFVSHPAPSTFAAFTAFVSRFLELFELFVFALLLSTVSWNSRTAMYISYLLPPPPPPPPSFYVPLPRQHLRNLQLSLHIGEPEKVALCSEIKLEWRVGLFFYQCKPTHKSKAENVFATSNPPPLPSYIYLFLYNEIISFFIIYVWFFFFPSFNYLHVLNFEWLLLFFFFISCIFIGYYKARRKHESSF